MCVGVSERLRGTLSKARVGDHEVNANLTLSMSETILETSSWQVSAVCASRAGSGLAHTLQVRMTREHKDRPTYRKILPARFY